MKRYKVLLSLFCVAVFFFLAVGSTGNDEETAAEAEEEAALREARSDVENLIADNVRMDTRSQEYENKIHDYTFEDDKLHVHLIATNTGFADHTKDKVLRESRNILRAFYNENEYEHLQEVDLEWQIPLPDDYGHVELRTMVLVVISRETADKIDWDGFGPESIPKVADNYWEAY